MQVIARIALVGAMGLATGCFSEPGDGAQDADGDTQAADDGVDDGVDDGAGPAGDGGTTTGLPDDGDTSDDGVVPDTGTEDTGSTGTTGDDGDTTSTSTAADTGPSDESESSTGEPVQSINDLEPGDLVIVEVMWDPHCDFDACEWFEIINTTELAVNLLDLHVQDNSFNAGNEGRITDDIILEAGGLAVVARGNDFWPYDFVESGVYGPDPGLNNGSPDRVVILDGEDNILDQTPLLPFDAEEGVSWAYVGDTIDDIANDESDDWCHSVDLIAGTEVPNEAFGTPLEPNVDCVL